MQHNTYGSFLEINQKYVHYILGELAQNRLPLLLIHKAIAHNDVRISCDTAINITGEHCPPVLL